jgi:peptide/nickel transport system permease protein
MSVPNVGIEPRSRAGRARAFIASNRLPVGMAVFLAIAIGASFTAQWWLPMSPTDQVLLSRLRPPIWLEGGEMPNLLGTDELGRDMLARVIYGGRVSYLVGLLASTAAAAIGITLGILAAYRRGLVENVVLRVADTQTAFPFLIIAITIVAIYGATIRTIVVTLIVWQWVPFTRLAHAKTLGIKETEFFKAATAIGRRPVEIAFVHILPNILPPLVVVWTFVVARSILAESGLSYLGLGVPPPTPTWGGMLSSGRGYLEIAWWIPLMPGLTIVAVVAAINVLGDWMSDRWDPRER